MAASVMLLPRNTARSSLNGATVCAAAGACAEPRGIAGFFHGYAVCCVLVSGFIRTRAAVGVRPQFPDGLAEVVYSSVAPLRSASQPIHVLP